MKRKRDIHRRIIESCKQGDERARYELYQLYSKAMFNVSYRLMNNRESAEDMLQEAFTQAFMNLNTFRYESTFGSWLKRITVNTCINAINRRKVDIMYCDELYDQDLTYEEENAELPFTVADVVAAMEKLPDGGRMVFSLYLLEGYDHGEIAGILNISESTSKTQYLRAKRRMVAILNEQKRNSTINNN